MCKGSLGSPGWECVVSEPVCIGSFGPAGWECVRLCNFRVCMYR